MPQGRRSDAPDLFLSHNSRDKREVEALAYELLAEGIAPWLDLWELTPGEPWQPGLEHAIRESRAVAVCIGAHGLGAVQVPEVQLALDEAFQDESQLVIPIWLESAGTELELPRGFLQQRTWIDLRQDRSEGVRALVRALVGRPKNPRGGVPKIECPYRGLLPFYEEHARWFFGRSAHVTQLLKAVSDPLENGRPRLTTLVGASGSGKSSLALAGLVPAVRTGELDPEHEWRVLTLRPGPRPLHELALQLSRHVNHAHFPGLESLEKDLLTSPRTLCDQLELEAVRLDREPRFLLLIDQFEELFSQTESDTERDAFVATLLYAASAPGARCAVLVTLRADFMGRALSQTTLAPYLQDSLQLATPLTRAELTEAVRRPALMSGVRFPEGLVTTLVDAVEGQPGDLPLLQFALEELWKRRENEALTWSAYDAIGGVKGAIAKRADAVTDQLQQDGIVDDAALKELFGRLVQLGEGTPDTRRRVAKSELESVAPGEAIEALVKARLLRASRTNETDPTSQIDVAHEALIREWTRMREWIDEGRAGLRAQGEIRRAAYFWRHSERDPSDLWSGARLRRALELVDEHTLALSHEEHEFVEASRAADTALEEARQRRAWLAVGSAALVTLVAVGAAIFVAQQNRQLEEQSDYIATVLSKARGMAERLVFQVDQQLAPIAGASSARRDFLEATGELVDVLSKSSVATGDTELLRVRMVNHIRRGDVALLRDDLGVARAEYSAAIAIAERLAESDPGNSQWQRDLSVSHNKLGDLARAEGDLAAARSAFEAALAIAERLAGSDPGNSQWQRDLSVSHNKLGDLARAEGDLAAARSAFEADLAIAERLAESDPGNSQWQRDLSVSHNKLGDLARAEGDLAAARSAFEADLAIAERLAESDPGNSQWQRDLSVSHNKLGDLARAEGDLAAARSAFEAALAIAERLAGSDPGNSQWQRDLSISQNKLGDLARAEGDLAAARRAFEAALAIRVRLAESDPGNSQWQRDLSISHEKLGDLARAEGDLAAARRAFEAALAIAERLVEISPSHVRLRSERDALRSQLAALRGEE